MAGQRGVEHSGVERERRPTRPRHEEGGQPGHGRVGPGERLGLRRAGKEQLGEPCPVALDRSRRAVDPGFAAARRVPGEPQVPVLAEQVAERGERALAVDRRVDAQGERRDHPDHGADLLREVRVGVVLRPVVADVLAAAEEVALAVPGRRPPVEGRLDAGVERGRQPPGTQRPEVRVPGSHVEREAAVVRPTEAIAGVGELLAALECRVERRSDPGRREAGREPEVRHRVHAVVHPIPVVVVDDELVAEEKGGLVGPVRVAQCGVDEPLGHRGSSHRRPGQPRVGPICMWTWLRCAARRAASPP